MTKEEVDHINDTYGKGLFSDKRDDMIWVKAFNYYNKNYNGTPLQMGCSICYKKVLNFINEKFK